MAHRFTPRPPLPSPALLAMGIPPSRLARRRKPTS